MEYFSSAYQLGMTATPRRKDNANTYAYFGDPVYSYSLKQGIADGYLTPFRVRISESNIDEYVYDPDDDVEGEIDTEKTYTEKDFYNGNIEMRQRDEYRVKELLAQIEPDEKTIIFCATQRHAEIVRDLVNQYKKSPARNYCERVTADDGKDGEECLKKFQDNEKLLPTILTTSRKLSTGVDARNVRNIVLMRPINNMIEFNARLPHTPLKIDSLHVPVRHQLLTHKDFFVHTVRNLSKLLSTFYGCTAYLGKLQARDHLLLGP